MNSNLTARMTQVRIGDVRVKADRTNQKLRAQGAKAETSSVESAES